MAEGITLRIVITGVVPSTLYITDVTPNVYIGVGETVDLNYTTEVSDSFETGAIFTWIGQGALTGTILLGDTFESSVAVTTEDEGVAVETETRILNFVGAGVTATSVGGNQVDVAIPGGGGGADLATTLGVGNTTGGTDIALSVGDELRGGIDGGGLNAVDGDTYTTWTYGGASLGNGQYGYLIGGPLTITSTFDNGYGPSILVGDGWTSCNLDDQALASCLFVADTVNFNTDPYIEYSFVGGQNLQFMDGGYTANSICFGAGFESRFDDVFGSLCITDASNLVNVNNTICVGASIRYEPSRFFGLPAIGESLWVTNENEFVWSAGHSGLCGSYQMGSITLATQSTSSVPRQMSSGSATGTVRDYVLRPQSTISFVAEVSAYCTVGAAVHDAAHWVFKGQIKRDNAGNTTLINVKCLQSQDLALNGGGNVVAEVFVDATTAQPPTGGDVSLSGTTILVAADNTTEALDFTFAGLNSHTIRVAANISFAEAGVGSAVF